jgi:hypothetical protein
MIVDERVASPAPDEDVSEGEEPKVSGFYDKVIDRAELLAAMRVEGVDEELALLRFRLRETFKDEKGDRLLMLKGMELLIRALGVRYRMSKKRTDDFAGATTAFVTALGDQFGAFDE